MGGGKREGKRKSKKEVCMIDIVKEREGGGASDRNTGYKMTSANPKAMVSDPL